MKRVLLDTNIYGFIVVDPDRRIIHESIHAMSDILLYGFAVIREDLLRAYDELVKKSYDKTPAMERLSEQYYQLYAEMGGTSPKSKLINDFLIIACASLKDLDIVVSNDEKTMLNELAVKAYVSVNKLNNIQLPHFISYEEFKHALRR